MATRFRPSSRNLMGGKFWNEFTEWGRRYYQHDIEGVSQRKVFADGFPPGHVPTSEAQQLNLLRAARAQGDAMFTQSKSAQARLAQLEAKEAANGN
jgi:hypothetical protein